MTAADVLAQLLAGGPVAGRHLVVTAHADDETISFGGALCVLQDVVVLQLTDGARADTPNRAQRVAHRLEERASAFDAAGWRWPVIDCHVPDRGTVYALTGLLRSLREILARTAPDVVWTHPYEAGHLDHDSAAWLVQTACQGLPAPVRMEFASYHATETRQAFGTFWPNPQQTALLRPLEPDQLARKRAAMAAYWSQKDILRKFPTPERESYRTAPVYDFGKPAPCGRVRWDIKGYQPSTAVWRKVVRTVEQQEGVA